VSPTIYDVAERAGVSIATVSRALNGHSYLRVETRERVLQAVRDLNFVPNNAARGLSSGSTRVLGLLFIRSSGADEILELEQESLLFTDSVIRGAELSAYKCGYSLLLSGVDCGDSSPDVSALTGKCDGLIVLDRVLSERRVAPLAKRIPTVLLAGSGRSRSAITVRVDNAVPSHQLAEHLVVHHGYRRVAFLSGFADSPDSVARLAEFRLRATECGAIVEDDPLWSSDYTATGAVQAVERRLAAGRPLPEAIACANDQAAIGVIHGLQRAGVLVPRDIAVTGFDDIPVGRHMSPTLTTVRQPTQQLGSAAVNALVKLIEDPAQSQREIVLPTRVIIRASCGCDPVLPPCYEVPAPPEMAQVNR
jgi:LacI family transcriptional regulator